MAVTKSVGYPGPIVPADLAYWTTRLGRDYGVDGPDDWKVTPLANGLRQANVAAGIGYGRAIVDTATDTIVTFDPQVSQGTRWDLVVARRTWGATKATTFVVVKGGSTQAGAFGLRNKVPGTLDDQPIALVPINQGADNPGTPIDVRVWQANGQAFAHDALALQYMTSIGSSILIDDVVWHRIDDGTESGGWQTHSLIGVPLFGVGPTLTGGAVANGATGLIQAGSTVKTTNQNGHATIAWPRAFTGALIYSNLSNGDDALANDTYIAPIGGTFGVGGLTVVNYIVRGPLSAGRVPLPNWTHRVNWFALGTMV